MEAVWDLVATQAADIPQVLGCNTLRVATLRQVFLANAMDNNQGFQMGIGIEILLVVEHQYLSRLDFNDKSDFANRLVGNCNEITEADTPGMDRL